MRSLARIELSPYVWSLILWNDQPSMISAIKRLGYDIEVKPIAGRMCTLADEKQFHVGIFDGSIRTLIHELHHTVVELAKRIGMPICDKTMEPCAYLLDWMLGECLAAFKRAKRRVT